MPQFQYTLLILMLIIANAFSIEVSGANQSLEIESSARRSATAGVYLGMPGDLGSIYKHPAALLDMGQTWVLLSHFEHFEDSQYDHISTNIPLTESSALGFSLARFGLDNIPDTEEGIDYEGASYPVFSISDYIFSGTFAFSVSNLKLGGSLHLLYRNLDQSAFGFRTDISADYSLSNFRFAALIKGATSSAAKWESGTFEYTRPDLFVGTGYTKNISYIYGSITLAWQSKGLFLTEAKSSSTQNEEWNGDTLTSYNTYGSPLWKKPGEWFTTSSIAFEYESENGLNLSGGLRSLNTLSNFSVGAGITVLRHTKVAYSFQNHSDLSNTHHISLMICPEIIIARHFKQSPKIIRETTVLPPVPSTSPDQPSNQPAEAEAPKELDLNTPKQSNSVPVKEDIIIIDDAEEELIE